MNLSEGLLLANLVSAGVGDDGAPRLKNYPAVTMANKYESYTSPGNRYDRNCTRRGSAKP